MLRITNDSYNKPKLKPLVEEKKMEQLIGTISVDAGLCWIGDPCYIMGDQATWRVHDWGDFCKALAKEGFNDGWENHAQPLGDNIGLAVSTGYGDGHYPVYVKTNSDNKVKQIIVKFIQD